MTRPLPRTTWRRPGGPGSDPSVWAYNNALLHPGPLGDYESVLSELKEVESKDPVAPNVRLAQIEINLAAGRVTDAVAGAEAAQLLSFQAPMVMLSPARAYVADRNIAKARELTEAVRSTGRVSTPGSMLL